MTYRLNAHVKGDSIVLDDPMPPNLNAARVTVLIEEPAGRPSPEEMAQSHSGFATEALMDPAEDVWEND